MKIARRPMLATILFGLVCAISFVPASVALSFLFSWPTAFRFILWFYLVLYGVLLTKWSNTRFVSLLFPLLLVLFFVFWGGSSTSFLLLALGVFSWIRSGICFQQPLPRMLGIELVTTLGGGAFVAHLAPHSPATWAMGVWMFFLIQSLYFVFVRDAQDEAGDVCLDPFEEARRRAEEVLYFKG
jgi:hypothetical protein